MNDGALDDWILEGDATPLEPIPINNVKKNMKIPALNINSDVAQSPSLNSRRSSQGLTTSRASSTGRWNTVLTPGENEVFSSFIWKRKGLFSKSRQLLLTDSPRLLYLDPNTVEVKGEILWTPDKPIKFISLGGNSFDLMCSATGRTYHFTAVTGNSKQAWSEKIAEWNKRYCQ